MLNLKMEEFDLISKLEWVMQVDEIKKRKRKKIVELCLSKNWECSRFGLVPVDTKTKSNRNMRFLENLKLNQTI